ncbi:hypothetical protein KXD93_21325 [Mucilaginibacter sp. BJC16-A38]|uniref:hypothetical protein n=1 Tax=Mucilaginibacter phenanthrenivorans TaxID=1234842 RepID=UPI0021584A76|nr:hypothetical protein [Mucilaginibacter phenanthrenivorans]MCR8560207.1 hypothetical protein [Mucilaginibacter phenanthrenivorans]
MADNSTLVAVSAFSGLAGALFTQLINLANTYFTDSRKQKFEVDTQLRNKKMEIGESFFYVTGEKLTAIKKNIAFWKNGNKFRTDKSLEFLYKETAKFNTYMEKLNADNWKFNLISLYFDISFTNEEVARSNERSHELYLSYLDLAEGIRNAAGEAKEALFKRYAVVLFDMCDHYEEIYNRLEHDMGIVRTQLLGDFQNS